MRRERRSPLPPAPRVTGARHGAPSREDLKIGALASLVPSCLLVLTGVYFLAGKFGLALALVHASASPVWPPTGIALAAALLLGYRVWPALFLGAFLVNVTTAGSVWTSLGIAGGNTLEGLLGAFLVQPFANGRRVFDRARDILTFAALARLGRPAGGASPSFRCSRTGARCTARGPSSGTRRTSRCCCSRRLWGRWP